MTIQCFPLGPMEANCYVLRAGDVCAVADPGAEGETVARYLESQGLTPQMILLTHGHFDHVGGVKTLVSAYPGLPVYLHPEDRDLTPVLCRGLYWTDLYEEGDTLSLGEETITVLHTPGHTPGSVCLMAGDSLLTGDTLFAGSCGRTDFPGGSGQAMLASLARLGRLEGDWRVLPGHGADSTLAEERRSNPYMGEALAL